MGFDSTRGTDTGAETVQKPAELPPPPPDNPGSPGQPSRAESHAAAAAWAKENRQQSSDQNTDKPSTPDADTDKREQGTETDTASGVDQSEPVTEEASTGDRPYESSDEHDESTTPESRDGPEAPQAEQVGGGQPDQPLPGEGTALDEGEVAAETGDPVEASDQRTRPEAGGTGQRPGDAPVVRDEDEAVEERRAPAEQPATEPVALPADRNVDAEGQNSSPDAAAPDHALLGEPQQSEQPTGQALEGEAEIPDPAGDAAETAAPIELADGQTQSADQPGDADPQTLPDQTETEVAAKEPDLTAELGSDEDNEGKYPRLGVELTYEQFIAGNYESSERDLEEALDQLQAQREKDDPDSALKDGDTIKPPTGEELAEMESEDESRSDRLRKKMFEESEDISEGVRKASDRVKELLTQHPPTGHPETVTRPELIPAPHDGIAVGDALGSLIVVGVLFSDVASRVRKRLRR